MTSALLVIDVQAGLFDGEKRPGDADGVISRINALAERARRRLDALGVMELRVAGRLRLPLPEAADVVERHRIAREVQPGVEEHAAVTGGQDEAIAVQPVRFARIVAEDVAVERGTDLGGPWR